MENSPGPSLDEKGKPVSRPRRGVVAGRAGANPQPPGLVAQDLLELEGRRGRADRLQLPLQTLERGVHL
eukprot:scaffold44914_cov77-Phaeocystis_antarctica.AAC.1